MVSDGVDATAGTTTPPASRLLDVVPVLLVLGGVALVARRAARPIADPDAWWHLRLGRDLWEQRSLTTPAGWSPRATVPWVPSEPVPEVVAAGVHAWAGLPGLAWLHGAAMVAVLLAAYAVCRRVAPPLVASVVTLGVLAAALSSFTPRPQLVSYVLVLAVPLLWERAARTLRPPWWLVPLTWAWSCCHGFWAVGVVLSGVCWLGLVLDHRPPPAVAARLALVPVASLAVVLLNPSGWEVVLAPLSVSETTQYISEWRRSSLTQAGPVPGALLLAVTTVVLIARRRHLTWTDGLQLAAAVFLWWYAIRTVALAALVVAPVLARHAGALVPDRPRTPTARGERWLLGVGAACCLLALAVAVPRTSEEPGAVPDGLADELDRLPAGTSVLNEYGWGGWLSWRHPDLDRTSDGLVVPYDPDYVGDLYDVERTDGDWQALLPGLDVDYALFDPEANGDVVEGLRGLGWTVVAGDADAVLLSRPGVTFPRG